jgi:hypothetical protein
MIKPIIVVPPFFHPSDACGQIQRHFFPNLPKDTFHPYLICRKIKGIEYTLPNSDIIALGERQFIVFLEKIVRNIGLTDLTFLPDYQRFSWGTNASKKILSMLKDDHYDYIHTINSPCSAHLVGLEAKKKTGIPWIAQFYDPWHNNPARNIKNKKLRSYDASLERQVAENADIIIHTNSVMVEAWNKTYGDIVKGKQIVLPHLTEIPTISSENVNKSDILNISHIGNFQEFRNSITFIKAIHILLAANPELANKIKINYVGMVTPNEIKLINKYKLDQVFNLVGFISEEECNPYFEKTNIFLAIDTNHEHNVFFPSKILKYYCYKKPILGLTTSNSVLYNELVNSRNYAFGYNDAHGVAEFLKNAIVDRSVINTFDKDYWIKFSVENVLSYYQKIVSKLISYNK